MPTLNWIGKEAVVKHHRDVPFRLLEPVPELSCGAADSGNLLVQGDNLHALKALLPRYAGQVKCIYIDPPYNTGNEDWVYRGQTLRALRDRGHPYHAALRDAGPVAVMDLEEVKTAGSVISSFADIFMAASAISTARGNSPAPVGWIPRCKKGAFNSGCATWCGGKAARSSCKKPMAASIRIFSASCRTGSFWPWNTKAPTAGPPPKTTG